MPQTPCIWAIVSLIPIDPEEQFTHTLSHRYPGRCPAEQDRVLEQDVQIGLAATPDQHNYLRFERQRGNKPR